MRLPCPLCGERDVREFYYKGHATALARPSADGSDIEWDDYLHNRDNPAGVTQDLWHHSGGCSAWLVVTRDTTTHEVLGAELAAEAKR